MVYINGCLIFINLVMLLYAYTVLHNMVQGVYHKIDELNNDLKKSE